MINCFRRYSHSFGSYVRSLSKHVDNIVSDDRITNNEIIGFTETQINPSDFNCKIIETLRFFQDYLQ